MEEDIWKKINDFCLPWVDPNDENYWSNSMSTPVSCLYEEFQRLTIIECKKMLSDIENEISKNPLSRKIRKYLYVSFVTKMASLRLVHSNISGCEVLIALRVKDFFEQAKVKGDFPSLTSDDGCVPLLIFVGKFLPLLTYHAEVNGISRSIFTRMSWLGRLNFFKYVVFRMKGFYPVIEYHMPKTTNKKFTKELLFDDYLVTSEIFKRNQNLKGTFQTNWYIDPQLKEITPHLGELGMLASEYGALVICLGEDVKVIEDSTRKSATRLKLYKDGLYKPKRYARFWSRKDIMEFSKNYKPINIDLLLN